MTEDSRFSNSSFAILAGGRASRMHASCTTLDSSFDSGVLDKCLLSVGGKTILERIVEGLRVSDFSSSALNTNGELARFADISDKYALALVGDVAASGEGGGIKPSSASSSEQSPTSLPTLPAATLSGPLSGPLLGPLAGLLSSLRWARACGSRWLLSVPGDCPFLPSDLFPRLSSRQSAMGSSITCAASRQSDGVFRRHSVTALWDVSLQDDLADSLFSGGIRKIDLWTSRHSVAIEEWDSPLDFFFNVNDRADLEHANSLARTDFR